MKKLNLPLLILFLFFRGFTAFANLEGNQWVFHWNSTDYFFTREGIIRGSPMVPLQEIVQKLSLEMTYDSKKFEVMLREPKSKRLLLLKTYSNEVKGSFGKITLSKNPEFIGVKLCVPIDFGDRVLRPLLSGKNPLLPKKFLKQKRATLVIDPGHGGNDFGTKIKIGDKFIFEKDIALQVALDLKKKLIASGVDVELTREEDIYLTLPERTQIANQLKAKLFVSLHLNHSDSEKLKGAEIFVLSLDSSDQEGRASVAVENQIIPDELPEGIEKAVANIRAQANFENSLTWAKTLQHTWNQKMEFLGKGIKSGPFYVLYGAEMPALLLELGFLSNAQDRNYLLSENERSAKIITPLTEVLKKVK